MEHAELPRVPMCSKDFLVAYYLVRAGIVWWLLLGDSHSGCWVAEVQKHGNSFMGQSREPQSHNCDQDRFYNYWVELKGSPVSQAKSLRGIAFLKWIWWELGFFSTDHFCQKIDISCSIFLSSAFWSATWHFSEGLFRGATKTGVSPN